MVEKESAKEKIKKYKIKINKYFDGDSDKLKVCISVNNPLQKMLKQFAVISSNDDELMGFVCDGKRYNRYKVRSVLVNSCNWVDRIHGYFFTKEMIEKKKFIVEYQNYNEYVNLMENVNSIREMIGKMEEIQTSEKLSFTITTQK